MNTSVHQCLILDTQFLISLDNESYNEINENDYYGLWVILISFGGKFYTFFFLQMKLRSGYKILWYDVNYIYLNP